MAEFVVKIADDRGRVHQHIEQGYSEAEVRDRFSAQGYLVYWVKPQGMMAGGFSLSLFVRHGRGRHNAKRRSPTLPRLRSFQRLIRRKKPPDFIQFSPSLQSS